MLGIDVSNHQGVINWQKVAAAGVRFAFLKATEGTGFVDGTFTQNRVAAKRAGVRVAGYHFARPGQSGAVAQADHFLSVARPVKGELLPVLDYEDQPKLAWAEAYATRIHDQTGRWPILYASTSFVNTLGKSAILAHCPYWRAEYGINDGKRHPLSTSTVYNPIIHQYTSKGTVDGVTGNVDMNWLLSGTLDALTIQPRITAYTIEYRDKTGAHHKIQTRAPVRWQLRHPRVKRHGRIIQTPIYEP